MVLAPVMVLAYVMVDETADMVVIKEADIVGGPGVCGRGSRRAA